MLTLFGKMSFSFVTSLRHSYVSNSDWSLYSFEITWPYFVFILSQFFKLFVPFSHSYIIPEELQSVCKHNDEIWNTFSNCDYNLCGSLVLVILLFSNKVDNWYFVSPFLPRKFKRKKNRFTFNFIEIFKFCELKQSDQKWSHTFSLPYYVNGVI